MPAAVVTEFDIPETASKVPPVNGDELWHIATILDSQTTGARDGSFPPKAAINVSMVRHLQMLFRGIFMARGMLWATAALTAAYVLAIALFVYTSGGDPSFRVDALGFAEALFSTPLLIACGLAIWLNSVQARRTFFGFAVGYIILTLDVFYSTFTGEHDAQYQLLLFQIPMVGFPALLIVGVVAGLFGRTPSR